MASRRYGRRLIVQPNCLKNQLVCGTVYVDMHYKDLLGSIVRVEHCIPVPDFYLVLNILWCWKSTNESINQIMFAFHFISLHLINYSDLKNEAIIFSHLPKRRRVTCVSRFHPASVSTLILWNRCMESYDIVHVY